MVAGPILAMVHEAAIRYPGLAFVNIQSPYDELICERQAEQPHGPKPRDRILDAWPQK